MTELRYRSPLRELIGLPSEQVQAETVQQALRHIRRTHGREAYKMASQMLITVDGTSILLRQNRKTPLPDGSVVAFLPLSAGG